MIALPPLVRERLLTPPVRRALWQVLGLSLVINILLLTSPLYMLQMYDRVLTSRSLETLYAISAIALFLLAAYGALEVMRSRALVGIGLAVDDQINASVFDALFRSGSARSGAATAQPVRDLEAVRGLMSGPTLAALFDLPWVPFYLALIFIMHPLLGAVALGGASVSVFLTFLSERTARRTVAEAGQHQMAAARFVDASLRNVDAVLANGMVGSLRQRWLKSYAQSVDIGAQSSDQLSAYSGSTKALRITMQSVMLGVGAWLALGDQVSPGVMIAGSIIFGRAVAPLDQAIAASKGMISAWLAVKRLDTLLTKHAQTKAPMPLPKPQGALKVEGLALVPPGTRKPVLQGLKFELAAGEMMAVVGPSASGKSTLAKALVGLWVPAGGKVMLDGADLAQWEPDVLGRYLGYLPQDVELIAGTVKDNIARFAENADPAKVLKAAEEAGCHQLILDLPEGYDTRIGDGGVNLSGGQSQRIALARCYFDAPSMVVLDEPDASLDAEGIARLDEALADMKKRGTTAVIVTHNLRLMRHADKALMLGNGGMTYFGSPQELMQKLSRKAPA